MSKLMSVLGVILMAVGVVLGVLELMQPGRVQGLGISIGTAVDLIIGGILSLGLGGVIAALSGRTAEAMVDMVEVAPAPAPIPEVVVPAPEAAVAEEAPAKMRFGFGKKLGAATATVAAGAAVAEAAAPAAVEAVTSPVQETLDALEQAKQDIKGALGGVESIVTPEPDAPAAAAEAPAEDELYVVEEKSIRGRPARILSDDTVEAETDEGWMRFENLEHLNEYLDAANA